MDYTLRVERETRCIRDIRKCRNDLDSCMRDLKVLRRAYNDSLLLMFDSVSLARSDSYWPDWESELLEFKVQLSTLKDNLQELHDVVQNGHSWAEAEYQAAKRRNESCRQGERK